MPSRHIWSIVAFYASEIGKEAFVVSLLFPPFHYEPRPRNSVLSSPPKALHHDRKLQFGVSQTINALHTFHCIALLSPQGLPLFSLVPCRSSSSFFTSVMTTKYRHAAAVAESRILELAAQFENNTHESTVNMPSKTKIIGVPHLGGIDCAYQMPHSYDPSKPTLCLVNSFTTSSELYRSQYANKELTDKMNLIAIELLGHGDTRTKSENFTYWDTAIMNLQALDALNMSGDGKKVFVLGTSQGGWICLRMALLAPDKVSSSLQSVIDL